LPHLSLGGVAYSAEGGARLYVLRLSLNAQFDTSPLR
jgi:hypothetical protein